MGGWRVVSSGGLFGKTMEGRGLVVSGGGERAVRGGGE